MEKLLTNLFDYQRFVNNPELASVIASVEKKYSIGGNRRILSAEELELVNAAGTYSYEGKDPLGKDQDKGLP